MTSARLAKADDWIARLVDNIPGAAVYRFVEFPDGSLRFTYVSDGFEALTGYPASLVLEEPWAFFLMTHEDDVAAMIIETTRARSTRTPFNAPYRFKHPDGTMRWVRARARPTIGEDGSVVWDGAFVDETRERAMQAELRESESRFRSMADDAPVLIWMSGETGGCTYFNQTWLEFTGRSLEQELNDGWAESVHPDDRTDCINIYLKAFAARQPFEMEYRLRRHDGVYRWVLDRGRPRLSQDNGELIGYIGTCTDITVRKEAEDKLRASEEHLRDAQRITKTGSWRHVVATGQEEWSEQMCRAFGRDPKENTPIFDDLLSYLNREDEAKLLELRKRAIEEGAPYECEFRVFRSDGSVVHIHNKANVRRDASDRVVELYGTCQDVTDHVLAEKNRLEFQERLASAQRLESLGLLAGGIAHDFNNLLMGVLMEASIAAREVKPPSQAGSALANIQEAATRMAELTNQLLAYAGRGRFVLEFVDPNEVTASMLELLERNISKHASLESEISREPATIEIDSSQLRQVIMNLVLNAADALDGQPGRIAVRTTVEQCPNQTPTWVLEVADSGVGMSEEIRKRIFEPFFTTKKAGRGLGLSTVHGIVQRCNGQIEIQSTPHHGTTFVVRLPLVAGVTAQRHAPEPERKARPAMRILVADDEAMVRRSIRRMLELNHANVVEVADGAAAIEALNHSRESFDLILLDVVMPRKNGYEVLAEIRERHPQSKVILMSGYNNPSAIAGAKPSPYAPDAALQKPFAWTDLTQVIHNVMGPGQPSAG